MRASAVYGGDFVSGSTPADAEEAGAHYKEKALRVLEFMGLTEYRDWYAAGLPYGILKKIEIARTLMCDPS